MTIAAYVRVSSRGQKTDSQESEIKKWFAGNGIDPAKVLWFSDMETGKTLDRPGFQRLQKAVFDGTMKTVVVWKLDRLSRRLRDGVNILADWCEKGLRVIVVTQSERFNQRFSELQAMSFGFDDAAAALNDQATEARRKAEAVRQVIKQINVTFKPTGKKYPTSEVVDIEIVPVTPDDGPPEYPDRASLWPCPARWPAT